MKTMKIAYNKCLLLPALFSVLVFALLSCEQPFKAGLGPVIDIRPPTVTLERPGAGAYISGVQRILLGNAEDDYNIDYVEFKVTNQPSLAGKIAYCEGTREDGTYNPGWVRASLNKSSQNKGEWDKVIDTTQFPDGDLKIKLKAWDAVGKNAETDEIILLIRNNLPRIKLINPRIDENRSSSNMNFGEISDYPNTKLNYSQYDDEYGGGTNPIRGTLPNGSVYQRIVTEGSAISGSITYDEFIYEGPETTDAYGKRYPPQIRIWKVVDVPDNSGYQKTNLNTYYQCRLGELPSVDEVPWRSINDKANFGDAAQVIPIGTSGNYIISYPIPSAGSFYGFEIRVQSKDPRGVDGEDGLVSFRYPRDFWPNIERDGGNWENPSGEMDDFITENRYVLMYVQSLGSAPVAALWGLEDFLKGNYNSSNSTYATLQTGSPPANIVDDGSMYHPYINKSGLLNKNNAFTLRIKASHSQGINSAEVYWELDHNDPVTGKPVRGRFIWDPAVYDSATMGTELNDASKGRAITESYDTWGFIDRNNNWTRNFIFTYDESNNKTTVQSGAGHGLGGSARIQVYRGSLDWDLVKKSGIAPTMALAGNWIPVTSLKNPGNGLDMEGTYSLEVYVRQNGMQGSLNSPHLTSAQFKVDIKPPEVEITGIEGIASKYVQLSDDKATVNGVVQFNLRFEDNGSNIKLAASADTGYYGVYERRYLLVNGVEAETASTALENMLNNSNPNARWPGRPATLPDTGIISGLTIQRHGGAGDEGKFRIKTTSVFAGDSGNAVLTDQSYYWLYVFARDNAFNVGFKKLKLYVDKATDNPELTGDVGAGMAFNTQVTSATDGPGATHNSFEDGNVFRNLNPASSIRLIAEDDDAVGSVSISIAGSTYSPADSSTIVADTPAKNVSNVDTAIFTARNGTTWEGMLRQEALVSALGLTGSSLPEGLYQLSMTVNDSTNTSDKFILSSDWGGSDTGTPQAATTGPTSFWIAIDNSNPLISNVTTTIGANTNVANGAYIGTANGITSGNDGLIIKGTVSDRNGPITLQSYTITGTSTDPANAGSIKWTKGGSLVVNNVSAWDANSTTDPKVSFDATIAAAPANKKGGLTITKTSEANHWTGDFTANIHIDSSVSSDIGIELVFQDRFGNLVSVNRSYKIDKTKPEARLRKKMETFERRDESRMTGSNPNHPAAAPAPGTVFDKFSRLANGVVSFTLNVTDNLKVSEVQWWLVSGNSATEPVWGNTTGSVKDGTLSGEAAGGTTVYIDTRDFADGEYTLFVKARDEANNESDVTDESKQIIYVLQSEDAPYIPVDSNSLSDGKVVGLNELRAVLTVNDDDGFSASVDGNGYGAGVRAGSIKIEMAPNNNGGNEPTSGWVTGDLSSIVPYPVTRVGTNNVKLDVSLRQVTQFDDILKGGNGSGTGGANYVDTTYWYRITAEDSYFDKYKTTPLGPKPADSSELGKTISRAYKFTLDSKPPKVKIVYPANNSTFSANNYNSAFILEGYMWDAHLDGTGANNAPPYYIDVKLGATTVKFSLPVNTPNSTTTGAVVIPEGSWTSLPNTVGGVAPTGVNPESGDTLVHFFISASQFTSPPNPPPGGINFNDDTAVPSGTNNMQFVVTDQSTKNGNDSLTFYKDLKCPTWDFTTPGFVKGSMLLPDLINAKTWWSANVISAGVSADFEAKRTWEKLPSPPDNNYTLPVVWNDGTSVPFIQGIFTDEISFIDVSSFKIKIDGNPVEVIIDGFGQNPAVTVSDKRSANWRVYLTNDGKSTGTSLCDGVHSIQITVKDTAGNEIPANTPLENDEDGYNKMYGFRINTKLPTSLITARPTTTNVFGTHTIGDKVFDIKGSATGANLHDAVVRIRYNGNAANTYEVKALTGADIARFTNTAWRYTSSTPVTNGGLLVDQTYSWDFDVRKADLSAAKFKGATPTNDLSGNYEIIVLAIDRSDKRSLEALEGTGGAGTGNVWSFKIDDAVPTFTFTSVRADPNNNTDAIRHAQPPKNWLEYNATTGAPELSSSITVLSSAPQVRGSVRDTNELKGVEIQYYKWDYLTNAWGTTSGWTALTPPPTDNEYSVAWDVPWTTVNDDGYYCIQLRARDTSALEGGENTLWPNFGASADGFNGNPAYSPFVFFFVDNAPPTIDNVGADTAFTTRLPPNHLTFEVTAADLNGFGRLRATVNRSGGSVITALTQTVNWPDVTPYSGARTWTPSITLTIPPATYSDGAYEVNFTVYDLTGKSATAKRPFTLDNTPPEGAIDEPAHKTVNNFPFASEIVVGGEPFDIKGTTDDKGPNGSASGVTGIWYRIGYGMQTALPSVTDGMTPAQRSAAIEVWANDGNDTDADFDDASITPVGPPASSDSLWFKYAAGAATPSGFNLPSSGLNLYSWQLSVEKEVPADYVAGTAILHGTTYTNGASGSIRLTRPIAPPGDDYQGRAIYSLPLVIRVADRAGNVFYELREIFLYPTGDNPTSKFITPNPVDTYSTTNPFGGQFYVDGVADDNVSIRNVIYRVKVANNYSPGSAPSDTVLTSTGTATTAARNAGGIVTMPGQRWAGNITNPDPEHAAMYAKWIEAGKAVQGFDGTGTLSADGWYIATLESTSSKAASMPWSFMLNERSEISDLIRKHGFAYNSAENNMIRVWVEVLVFDGLELSSNSPYNLMSLGSSPDANNRRPYKIEFYFKQSAPAIDQEKISNQGLSGSAAFDNDANYGLYGVSALAENNIRSKQFAIRANLNAGEGDARISEVAVRLPGQSGWATVFTSTGTSYTYTPNNAPGIGLSGAINQNLKTTTLTYKFDSTATTSGFGPVRANAWANSGGEFTIEVRVRDNGNPAAQATKTFRIGVDNFAPFADRFKNITNSKVAGSNVAFFGRAFDYEGATNSPDPTYKGLQRVRVWIRQGVTEGQGNYINLNRDNANYGAAVAPTSVTTTNVSARGKPAYNITWNTANPADSNKVVSIAQAAGNLPAYANTAVPNGNYVHEITKGAGGTWQPTQEWDVYWSFDVDTTKFPDGWITMYYVVEDHAGNAAYYTQTMCVMNNYPQITRVTLKTNNTGEGAVFTSDAEQEYVIPEPGNNATYYSPKDDSAVGSYTYADGYVKTGFISKNKIIGFDVNTVKGNMPLKYEATYVERYRVPMTKVNLQRMAGNTASPIGVNLTGITEADGTVVTGGIPVSEFLDLYTIANMGSFNEDEWRYLGVAVTAKPQNGAHFVFQGISKQNTDPQYDANNNIEKWSGDTATTPTTYVWAYRKILSTGQIPPSPASTLVNPTISANDFRFYNDGTHVDFAENTTGKIPEGLAKNENNAKYGTNLDGTVYIVIKITDNVGGGIGSGPAGATLTAKDMLYDAVVLGLRVYITDHNKPWARLYDLNPYMETGVRGNNSNATNRQRTIGAAATPGETFGANVLKGGLYNAGTTTDIVKSGYIEPKTSNIALHPYVTIPDNDTNPYKNSTLGNANGFVSADSGPSPSIDNDKVSGRIFLRGFAWDDQLINEIKIDIAGTSKTILRLQKVQVNAAGEIVLDANGNETIVPENNTTITFVRKMRPIRTAGTNDEITYTPATATVPAVQTAWAYEDLDWRTGHSVEWVYLWNTEILPAGITGRDARGGPYSGTDGNGIAVKVQAVDKIGTQTNNPYATDTTNPTTLEATPDARFHNQTTVDIVPYVTGIRRELPTFATTRSRQGWYSFFQGEVGIRVLGYNLGAVRANVSVTGAGAVSNATYTPAGFTPDENHLPNNLHVFGITGTSQVSGGITVTTGTSNTPAWNHNTLCLITKSWNKEYSENTPGSDLWVNKPYAHIWRTTEDAGDVDGTPRIPPTYFGDNTASGGSWAMESPSMVLEYGATSGYGAAANQNTGVGSRAGRLHGVWAHRDMFRTFYAANDTGAAIRLQRAQDPQAYTDLSYFPSGNNANNLTVVYTYQWDALPNLLIRTHVKYLADASGDPALGYNAGGTIVPFLIRRDNRNGTEAAAPTDAKRWQNIRTSMTEANVNLGNSGSGNGTDGPYPPHSGNTHNANNLAAPRGDAGKVYTVGYDAIGHNLFFVERIGNVNYGITTPSGSNPNNNNVNYLPLFIDGGSVASGGTGSRSARAGMWSAVDYVMAGSVAHPVVAYYDEANDTLRIAYGNNTDTANNNTNGIIGSWTRKDVLTGNLRSGSGRYVSMKVDKANFIHLAFYNSIHQTVVYAVSSAAVTDLASFNSATFNAYAVDSVVTGGIWTDISVEDITSTTAPGNPWIVYGDSNRKGNYDFARVAYKGAFSRPLTDPISGNVITGWEAVTMPANYTVADDRLNIEVWPPTARGGASVSGAASPYGGWHAAVGYAGTGTGGASSKMFRIGYFIKPAIPVGF